MVNLLRGDKRLRLPPGDRPGVVPAAPLVVAFLGPTSTIDADDRSCMFSERRRSIMRVGLICLKGVTGFAIRDGVLILFNVDFSLGGPIAFGWITDDRCLCFSSAEINSSNTSYETDVWDG